MGKSFFGRGIHVTQPLHALSWSIKLILKLLKVIFPHQSDEVEQYGAMSGSRFSTGIL